MALLDQGPGCALATTCPHENPRLYTYLPRAGNSPAAIKREALLYRRHSVETVFSTLKNRGIGAKGNQRLKLIGDDAFDWVTSLAALHLSAARIVHATGRYEHSHSVAEQLGYLTEPTDDNPFPYPTAAEQRRTAANDPAPPAIAPRSLRHPASPGDAPPLGRAGTRR